MKVGGLGEGTRNVGIGAQVSLFWARRPFFSTLIRSLKGRDRPRGESLRIAQLIFRVADGVLLAGTDAENSSCLIQGSVLFGKRGRPARLTVTAHQHAGRFQRFSSRSPCTLRPTIRWYLCRSSQIELTIPQCMENHPKRPFLGRTCMF